MSHSVSQIDWVGLSDKGLVRDHNEDMWSAYPDQGLFLLADGMGGHAAGEVAAQKSLTHLYELIKKWKPGHPLSSAEAVSFFQQALIKVNALIYQEGEREPSLAGMGTTICALYFFEHYALIAHVGDSRIYRFRESRLERLTEDHSLISELLSMGAVQPEESYTFPYKHVLTRAIGTNSTVEPTVNYISVNSKDCFLLCSDGLTNYVSDSEIERTLKSSLSLSEQAHRLVNSANHEGGGDNITLILAKVI